MVALWTTYRVMQGTIPGADPAVTPWTIYRAALPTTPWTARWMTDRSVIGVVQRVAQRAVQGASQGATPRAARGLAPG